jgi:hypothetical protein
MSISNAGKRQLAGNWLGRDGPYIPSLSGRPGTGRWDPCVQQQVHQRSVASRRAAARAGCQRVPAAAAAGSCRVWERSECAESQRCTHVVCDGATRAARCLLTCSQLSSSSSKRSALGAGFGAAWRWLLFWYSPPRAPPRPRPRPPVLLRPRPAPPPRPRPRPACPRPRPRGSSPPAIGSSPLVRATASALCTAWQMVLPLKRGRPSRKEQTLSARAADA